MEFFNSAVDVLKTLVVALGAGLGVWGAVNLMEGYGGDNPSAKSQGMVRQIFSRLRGIPKEQLITSRYAKETAERKNHLQALQAERDKAEKDLLALKTEILAVIKGESAFPKDTLAEMIAAQEKKHTELETLCEEASAELERNAELMANVSQLYEELISYADLYDSASFEAKKMIVSQLIRRVEVYRGYQIHVDFNFDLAQYLENSDELAC